MKEYDVSLDIISYCGDVVKISEVYGVNPKQLLLSKIKNKAIWRLSSGCNKRKSINDHVVAILNKIKKRELIEEDDVVKGIVLNVGVYYDTVTCTVNLRGGTLTGLISKCPSVSIEISCYPTESC